MDGQRLAVAVATTTAIQQLRHLIQLVEQLETVLLEADGVALLILQLEAGATPLQHHFVLVAAVAGHLLVGEDGGRAQQAPDQEEVEEADLVHLDAERGEGVHVHGAQLDVLDATLLQRVGRLLAAARGALGPDGGVQLVLQLKHVVVELAVLAVHLDPDLGELGIMGVDGAAQAADISRQTVVTDLEPRLGAVGVAEIRQAQRRGIRQVEGALAGLLERQAALAPLEEGVADGRGGAEQVGHQPAEAVDVANKPHVLVGDEALAAAPLAHEILPLAPEAVRHGEVEVHAGDHLHQAAVAILQPLAIEGLHPPDVGAAVLGQANALLVTDEAGHGEGPDPLLPQVVDGVAVDVAELLDQALDGIGRRGDELQQTLRVVGGDVGMGQGRPQASGVIGLGQGPLRGDAQTFAFDPAPDPLEGGHPLRGAQRSQQLGERQASSGHIHGSCMAAPPGAALIVATPLRAVAVDRWEDEARSGVFQAFACPPPPQSPCRTDPASGPHWPLASRVTPS